MLSVISGPMFSGKTETLLALINANLHAGNKVSVFKPANDTRYELDYIASHSGGKYPASLLRKDYPEDVLEHESFNTADVLVFDECQFFDRQKFELLIRVLLERRVICAGLPNDFRGQPFGPMPLLLSIADEIISLKGVCAKCKTINSSTRTYRKTKETAQVVVGGAEAYESRCFECWKDGVLNDTSEAQV